ncbi:MAG TPA: nucleotide sugar dehydrogenase [Sporichthyaceae bacterium]|nr:nucleotide sugar dehydrogenase [Sporichthyaceae bacterium]
MNVAVLGLGYVGTVTAACLAVKDHRVIGVDVDAGKVSALANGRPPVIEPRLDAIVELAVRSDRLSASTVAADAVTDADITVVCVGTPSAIDGSTDLGQLSRAIGEVGDALRGRTRPHTVVIRSTVPPGTISDVVAPLLTQRSGRTLGTDLHVASCPEFLREGSGVADFFDPPFLVIGGEEAAAGAVRELFHFLPCETYHVPLGVAEGLKYSCNAFHALKVAFANELASLYRRLGVDARQVMELFVRDTVLNVSPAYLRPGFAFGGSCLPKDVRSLMYLARSTSTDLPVLDAVLASNDHVVRDLADRVVRRVEELGHNRRVALLGLSFKAATDDLRESPNVALAELLIGKGLELRIHDPVVNPRRLTGANLRQVEARLPHLHRVLYDSPAEAVDGCSVIIVSNAEPAGLGAVAAAGAGCVFDLNGRLGARIEELPGYEGIGW